MSPRIVSQPFDQVSKTDSKGTKAAARAKRLLARLRRGRK